MLSTVANWLFGCAHRRTSFPITLRNGSATSRRDGAETYMVCLDCGKHMPYDWAAMRLTEATQQPTLRKQGSSALIEEGHEPFQLAHDT